MDDEGKRWAAAGWKQTPFFARAKAELLALGAVVTAGATTALRGAKPQTRVRSGACGGLDMVLPDGTYVNCPTQESFARRSPLRIVASGDGLAVQDSRLPASEPIRFAPLPSPRYYAESDGRAIAPRSIGQLCFDRLGIGLTNRCRYWSNDDRGCQFCSIGLNVGTEEKDKELEEILHVVGLGYSEKEPRARATHLLLGGGTWPNADAVAMRVAMVTREIKRSWNQPVYAMLAPPSDLALIDELCDAGVDEMAMNLELYDEDSCREFFRLKHEAISRDTYVRALVKAVERIGPIATRSILIVGLEPRAETLKGVRWLCEMGVMPILCPFRPLNGTPLEAHRRVEGTRTGSELYGLAEDAQEIADEYGLPLGPTCIPCQGNTLNVPGHPMYRYYGDLLGAESGPSRQGPALPSRCLKP